MAIVDLAEAYNVQILKDECDKYLSQIELNVENLYNIYEKLKLRSLKTALENLYQYVSYNAEIILTNPAFMTAKKDFVIDVVKLEALSIKEETLFDAIFKWANWAKWAKYRLDGNTENHDVKASDDKQRIKNELVEILPHIRFPIMKVEFLHEFIVPNGYLFSSLDELSIILRDADSYDKEAKEKFIPKLSSFSNRPRKCYNKIVFNDQNGKKAFAFIPDKEILESLKTNQAHSQCFPGSATGLPQIVGSSPRNQENTAHSNIGSLKSFEYCWQNDIPKPRQQAKLDLYGSKYYVIRSAQGKLGLKEISSQIITEQNHANQSNVQNNVVDYIAKLQLEDENFCISQECQFKVDAA